MPIPLFQVSNLTWAQAKSRVALVGGGQDDADQLIAAGYALEEAIRNWEAARDWKYLLHTSTNAVAGTISGTTTFTPTTVTDLRSIAVGMTVTGTGILTTPTTVSAVGATTLTLSAAGTNGATTLTFAYSITAGTSVYNLAADFREMYDVRLTGTNVRALAYVDKRQYDMWRADQATQATPVGYMLYSVQDSGQIELVPANGVDDSMLLVYYRRHYIPDAVSQGTTASDSVTLDFPLAYQTHILSWGKLFYLHQKGGSGEKLSFWTRAAEAGMRVAKGDDEFHPDAWHGFIPGSFDLRLSNPNDVTRYLGDF